MSYLDIVKKARAELEQSKRVRKTSESTQSAIDEEGEAQAVVDAWRRTLGVKLDVKVVRAHLQTLKRWHSQLERRSRALDK